MRKHPYGKALIAIIAITATVPFLLFQTQSAAAQSIIEQSRTIRVSGEGTVTAVPDKADISAGVITEAKSAQEALKENNTKMQALFDGMKAFGIDDKNIQTSGFSVSPIYTQIKIDASSGDKQATRPKIVAYRVSNTVHVTILDIEKLGPALDKFVSLGVNNLNGIHFGFSNLDELQSLARSAAAKDARERASLYAVGLEVTLGQVLLVSESGVYTPQPLFRGRAMKSEAMDFVPVAAGEQDIRATVDVTFAIE